MSERLDRLLTLRGDPVKGLPASSWEANLNDVDRDQLLRALIEVVRTLILPEWESRRRDDRRPQQALEATEAWLKSKSSDALNETKAAAKACTAARSETFGYSHRVPEAARAIAWSAGAKDDKHLWDALTCVEQELLARIAMVSEYHRQPEQRRAIVETLRKILAPPPAVAVADTGGEPVPYGASGTFSVGQRLTHPKFGILTVTATGDKWIDVTLEDGTSKRLAHKGR